MRLLYGNMLGRVRSDDDFIRVVGYVKSQRFALQLQLSLTARTGFGLEFESRELYRCLTPQSRVVMFPVTCQAKKSSQGCLISQFTGCRNFDRCLCSSLFYECSRVLSGRRGAVAAYTFLWTYQVFVCMPMVHFGVSKTHAPEAASTSQSGDRRTLLRSG